MANKETQDYFNREKESRLLLEDYLDSSEDTDRLDIVDKILGRDEIEEFVVYQEPDEDWEVFVDEYETDRDAIDEKVKEYYEPLSIEKRVRVNPRDPRDVIDTDNFKIEILITYGWPNVWLKIDRTAELDFYWWGDHLTRDFGSRFADKILSFYWLE